jgi:hypothetical protein
MGQTSVAALPWSWGSKICEELLRRGLKRVEHLFRGDVLDLGCGAKPYQPIIGSLARRWIGVDRPVTASGRPTADVYGSATALPFRKNWFDAVLCTQVLEHVATPIVLLQTNPLHEEPHDYFRFTNHGLEFLAREAGFEVIGIEPLGGAIATVTQMLIWHLGWIRRLPMFGRGVAAGTGALLAWLALKFDVLSRAYGGGAEKDTINWLLVARKPVSY